MHDVLILAITGLAGGAPVMSEPELTVTDRLEERPRFDLKRVVQVKPRDLAIRFLVGGLTSVGAGLVTLAFGPRAGGIFLAFPAILAASRWPRSVWPSGQRGSRSRSRRWLGWWSC